MQKKQKFKSCTGVQHSETHTRLESWSKKATAEVHAGFHFGPWSAGGSLKGEHAHEVTSSDTANSISSKSSCQEETFVAGTVWQWQYTFTGPSGCPDTVVDTNYYEVTDTRNDVPCCLPGMFAKGKNTGCVSFRDGQPSPVFGAASRCSSGSEVSCKDRVTTGLTVRGKPATCHDLREYCTSTSNGAKIREACCNTCSGGSHGGH